ncbi:hypothetical protein V492_02913 [Pseudogymnoascus sp. VKM F-4246]|nr:hypothetical protein V492_02913 [Pseudogymnoascus sp. VKM F-4246]
MKLQLNAIALLAMVSSRVAIAFPTEANNGDTALADAVIQEATRETPVEIEDDGEADIGDVTSYKDYGKYGDYGTYHYNKYRTYRSYKRDATPETAQETPIETNDDDETDLAANINYKNYGKYASYGRYPPPGYRAYGTYRKYPSKRNDNDDGDTEKYGSYSGYAPGDYGKYEDHIAYRRDIAPDAPTDIAKCIKHDKPPGNHDKYPVYANYKGYGESTADAGPPTWNYRRNLAPREESSADADNTGPPTWNYRRNLAPRRESPVDADNTIVPGVWTYGRNLAPDGVRRRDEASESNTRYGKYTKYSLLARKCDRV